MAKKLTTVGLIALACAMLAWKFWPQNPRMQVIKQVDTLVENLNKTPGEGNVTLIAKSEGLGNLFAPEVIVEVPPITGHYSPEELKSTASRIRAGQKSIRITISRLEVVMIDADRATATFTARLVADETASGRGEDTQDIRMDFQLIDGKWLITSVGPQPVQ